MKEFLMIFRGGENHSQSPDAMQAHMQKWIDWIADLRKEEIYLGGNPLEDGGKTMHSPTEVTDGPFAGGKELVGGYVLFKANNLEHAVEISKDCPTFENGGTVEVRAILAM